LIEVKHLTKIYGDHTAVDDLSFTIEPGHIYGLLGPNGAGKSTTMNIVTGCLAATSGTVRICGHDIYEDPIAAKRCIGYLPEIPPLYTDMTPFEFLSFVAEAKGVGYEEAGRQVREVMELTQIEDMKNRLIKNLSKGYRQRVGIAQAMLGNPEIIILDEPTVGLDPKQIIEIRELIRMLGQTRTVILSSHILAEISAVCDRVLIISHGKLVADDTIEHLESNVANANRLRLSVRGSAEDISEVLGNIEGILDCKQISEEDGVITLSLNVTKERDLRDDIFFAMAERRIPVLTMDAEELDLEDIFLSLTDSEQSEEETENTSEETEDTEETEKEEHDA
jgi:ABC-2 type transport system ATP-binding protein